MLIDRDGNLLCDADLAEIANVANSPSDDMLRDLLDRKIVELDGDLHRLAAINRRRLKGTVRYRVSLDDCYVAACEGLWSAIKWAMSKPDGPTLVEHLPAMLTKFSWHALLAWMTEARLLVVRDGTFWNREEWDVAQEPEDVRIGANVRGYTHDDPLSKLIFKETVERTMACADGITKRIVKLYYHDSLTMDEIAAKMHKSRGDVITWHYEFLSRVRTALGVSNYVADRSAKASGTLDEDIRRQFGAQKRLAALERAAKDAIPKQNWCKLATCMRLYFHHHGVEPQADEWQAFYAMFEDGFRFVAGSVSWLNVKAGLYVGPLVLAMLDAYYKHLDHDRLREAGKLIQYGGEPKDSRDEAILSLRQWLMDNPYATIPVRQALAIYERCREALATYMMPVARKAA